MCRSYVPYNLPTGLVQQLLSHVDGARGFNSSWAGTGYGKYHGLILQGGKCMIHGYVEAGALLDTDNF